MPATAMAGWWKELRVAVRSGKPLADGAIVAEGPHLLEEALRGRWALEAVLYTAESGQRHRRLIERASGEHMEVSSRQLGQISDTVTSQGVLAVLRPVAWGKSDLLRGRPLAIVLDGIQDPGNAGAMVRSGEAFGATGLILLDGSVRISNGKFLRASAGSAFRVPLLEHWTSAHLLSWIAECGLPLFRLEAAGELSLDEVNLSAGFALIVGGEGAGVSKALVERSRKLTIRTRNVESLNAAMACSIALYEANRQRLGGPDKRLPAAVSEKVQAVDLAGPSE